LNEAHTFQNEKKEGNIITNNKGERDLDLLLDGPIGINFPFVLKCGEEETFEPSPNSLNYFS